MAVTQQVRPHVFDTWMALLAGDRVWHDRADGPPTTRERAAAGMMITALGLTVLLQWVALVSRTDVSSVGDLTSSDLQRDFGADAIRRADVPGGSIVTVRIPLSQSLIAPPQEATRT